MTEKATPQPTDTQLLDWLEQETSMQVWFDVFGDQLWEIHRVTGNRNDREWTLVGEGLTVRAALTAAMQNPKSRT